MRNRYGSEMQKNAKSNGPAETDSSECKENDRHVKNTRTNSPQMRKTCKNDSWLAWILQRPTFSGFFPYPAFANVSHIRLLFLYLCNFFSNQPPLLIPRSRFYKMLFHDITFDLKTLSYRLMNLLHLLIMFVKNKTNLWSGKC